MRVNLEQVRERIMSFGIAIRSMNAPAVLRTVQFTKDLARVLNDPDSIKRGVMPVTTVQVEGAEDRHYSVSAHYDLSFPEDREYLNAALGLSRAALRFNNHHIMQQVNEGLAQRRRSRKVKGIK